ncbi:phosphorylase [Lichenifustis flavocetrariae]|uniref:Phosphorylase n=1 Tax=Lichenifustis flavocetrariae TaxID=2949735 RepID=A0AA41YZG3_9HYPH|nr:phosphorylase [Lichenifustis flavocetrariae]MCW6510110.1 phosphorylase [Lichenifustis flavocetrariae]
MTEAPPSVIVLAVTGLVAEARIVRANGVGTVAGGGNATRLASLLKAQLSQGARGVISIGIAGGLAPSLKAGAIVIADRILEGSTGWPTDPVWCRALAGSLPDAFLGALCGVDQPIAGTDAKAALHARAGALAVDMESHVAARLAASFALPFAALRVVADPASRSLPQAALVGMRPDGTTDVAAVLRALLRRPGDLAGLIHTARDAQAAFQSLKRVCAKLNAPLGFPYR